jgi:aspartate kinase
MLIVQKYGGTSVGNLERIKNVADRIIQTKKQGHKVVCVISAMAGETEKLINLAKNISKFPDPRHYDMLFAAGEQISSALLSIALIEKGYQSKTLLGNQVKIKTDNIHTRARIQDIDHEKILHELNNNNVIVIAGCQGVNENDDITTLGRGGSDTSAVAVAASLKADLCEIYTDVSGVFTSDPNICSKAKKLQEVSFDEMLEMASTGAKVLQIRSVEMAKKHNVNLCVRSTFSDEPGTFITEEKNMEKKIISAVTCDKKQARITLKQLSDEIGIQEKIFNPISDANIIVDVIVQNVSSNGFVDVSFTINRDDYLASLKELNKYKEKFHVKEIVGEDDVSKVSIIGVGMVSQAGVATKMFETLAHSGINIMMISTSEIKISCIIHEKYAELATQVLHEAFIENS